MGLEKFKLEKTIKELLEFGILNIDKCSGPTSFKVSEFVKKSLNLRKTSHFGTLDPKVTGVLPVGLNRACKLTGFFIGHDKEYIGIMRFHEKVERKIVEDEIKKNFSGIIKQLPPVRSRVARRERERRIISFEILEENGKDFVFKTSVQGGTYIRKLIHDLGENLGVNAHMLELRRIRAGIFKEIDSVNLYSFEKAVEEYKKGNEKLLREIVIPGEIITEIFPTVKIKEKFLEKILHGSPIKTDFLEGKSSVKEGNICVFCKDQFVGIFRKVHEEENFARSEFTLQPLEN